MNNYAYDIITNRISALLEKGTVPWRRPWKAGTQWPRNYVSQKTYRGINVFLLSATCYESPNWLTFRQVSQLGGKVRKGEKACPVIFWKPKRITDTESGEERQIRLLRLYNVFNAAQCDGLTEAPAMTPQITPAKPAQVVAGMPQPPNIRHGMASAFYLPSDDCIGMPLRERFDSEGSYYATLFHELVHSSGHERRLNRPTLIKQSGFGSDPYCKEELVAEMGAAFLCGHAEIIDQTIEASAAYIQGWLKRLNGDSTLIVHSAALAQKAADFILGKQPGALTEGSC